MKRLLAILAMLPFVCLLFLFGWHIVNVGILKLLIVLAGAIASGAIVFLIAWLLMWGVENFNRK